jgi:plasmid stabilization system protein ParE
VTALEVVVTDTAERHLEAIAAWWAVNRPDAPFLFAEEVEAAFERIARAPYSGAFSPSIRMAMGVRRILLCRSGYHVYYSIDLRRGHAIVRAV